MIPPNICVWCSGACIFWSIDFIPEPTVAWEGNLLVVKAGSSAADWEFWSINRHSQPSLMAVHVIVTKFDPKICQYFSVTLSTTFKLISSLLRHIFVFCQLGLLHRFNIQSILFLKFIFISSVLSYYYYSLMFCPLVHPSDWHGAMFTLQITDTAELHRIKIIDNLHQWRF